LHPDQDSDDRAGHRHAAPAEQRTAIRFAGW
jgi:hypothetical protein